MTQATVSFHTIDENSANKYRAKLKGWAIARLLPDMSREVVARFRSRSDAEGRMQLLQRTAPSTNFMIVFDCPNEEPTV